jgi:hypothetical protein
MARVTVTETFESGVAGEQIPAAGPLSNGVDVDVRYTASPARDTLSAGFDLGPSGTSGQMDASFWVPDELFVAYPILLVSQWNQEQDGAGGSSADFATVLFVTVANAPSGGAYLYGIQYAGVFGDDDTRTLRFWRSRGVSSDVIDTELVIPHDVWRKNEIERVGDDMVLRHYDTDGVTVLASQTWSLGSSDEFIEQTSHEVVTPTGNVFGLWVDDITWIYETPDTTVVRKYPRDDGRGHSSASRNYPPPKSIRGYGGYT